MADEAPVTVSGGIKAFVGTAAFVSFLIGAEVLRENGNLWTGSALMVAAFPIYLSPAIYRFLSSLFHPKITPPPAAQALVPAGNQAVTSIGQSGGITAHSVSVNSLVPNPKLNLVKREMNNYDGKMVITRYTVEVDSPFAVPALMLRVSATGLTDAKAGPVRGRGFLSCRENRGPDSFEIVFENPSGQYWIEGATPAGTELAWDYEFP